MTTPDAPGPLNAAGVAGPDDAGGPASPGVADPVPAGADHLPAGTDAFPIAWESPADPDLSWERDDMHMPFALAPLAEDYVRTLGHGFNLCYELYGGFPQRLHTRVWNGYTYIAFMANLPEAERAANRERWLAAMRERIAATERFWADEVLPELRELEAGIRSIDVESLDPTALAGAWDAAWASVSRMWDLHFLIIIGPYMVLEDLADLYEAAIPDAASGDAMRLAQGAKHDLLEVELGLERLAAAFEAAPAVAAILRERPRGSVRPEDLAAAPGGAAVVAELGAFLDRHGHLGQSFDDLMEASWTDEPRQLLGELALRLSAPPEPAMVRQARLAAEADRLAAAARERLAGEPDRLAEFERLLGHARTIGHLTEGHNYWIDRMAQGRIRTLSLRVGGRLVASGVIAEPHDVLFLHRDEVRTGIEAPTDMRALVTLRRAEHERWRATTPPRFVGATPGPPNTDRFDGERFTSTEADVILGTGASAGIVTGPARVVLGPADFGRIQPGDIIVCPSSNPSWVPVFTIAGGLVTNTGGVLSHAAVVAREFALPAVVGTTDATTRIRDGRRVEIDGTSGRVRLL
ncbi:MAG: hypothetical protein HYX57_05225 [Chloroflexi bacterium]|nr:hypothetical protein [Chloroflexota bacterium]